MLVCNGYIEYRHEYNIFDDYVIRYLNIDSKREKHVDKREWITCFASEYWEGKMALKFLKYVPCTVS